MCYFGLVVIILYNVKSDLFKSLTVLKYFANLSDSALSLRSTRPACFAVAGSTDESEADSVRHRLHPAPVNPIWSTD